MRGKLSLMQNGGELQIVDPRGILSPDHVLAIRLMGFNKQSEAGYITDSSTADLAVTVSAYLQNLGYELVADASITSMLESLERSKLEYRESFERGQEIKGKISANSITPPSFKEEVRIKPYQAKSVAHMLSVYHAANFSVPGSGKTIMTYAVYDILKSRGEVSGLLVIGPLSSFAPWEDECRLCMRQPPTIFRYLGPERRDRLDRLSSSEVVLTTYGTASNDSDYLSKYFMAKKNIMMVIDESHHIKKFNKSAIFSNQMINLGKYAKRRYILSGTPMPKGYEDLWSQITFLWPHNKLLGSRSAYEQMLERNDYQDVISERIDFLWTRVTNQQLKSDLPPMLDPSIISIPMSPSQEEIYVAIEQDMLRIEKKSTGALDFAQYRKNRILRLLQAVTNPSVLLLNDASYGLEKFYTGDTKIDHAVAEYQEVSPKLRMAANLAVELAKKNQNVVVWTVFVANVKFMRKAICDLDPAFTPIEITGEVPLDSDDQKSMRGREELIREFKSGSGKIMVATLGSIAESISLHHSCQRAIYLERGFNAGQYMQSLSRIYRIGSDKLKAVKFTFMQSVFSDQMTRTIDHKIDVVLKNRIRQMYALLDDDFALHPLDLDADAEQVQPGHLPEDDAREVYSGLIAAAKSHEEISNAR